MITEVYTIEQEGFGLDALVADGENALLRDSLELPEMKLKDSNAAPFKFRPITETESKVFKILFPVDTALEKYDSFVPNEVLEALKDFRDTCPTRLQGAPRVWHAKDYDPDPVLVQGFQENPDYNFTSGYYLIARWGKALLPFEELEFTAFHHWRAQRLNKLRAMKQELKAAIKLTKNSESINGDVNPALFV
mgnify:CR=1 FL=1|tara:strand:- start:15408 stop:15983 length:576 start_codon:yes stop_codon:yes gene_type:complete